MKVIEKKLWEKEYVCTGRGNGGMGCGSKLLVELNDLFQTGRCFMDGETETYVTFKCCVCGACTDIDGYTGDVSKLPRGNHNGRYDND